MPFTVRGTLRWHMGFLLLVCRVFLGHLSAVVPSKDTKQKSLRRCHMLMGSSPVPAADTLKSPSIGCRLLAAATSWTDQHNALFLTTCFPPCPIVCIVIFS